MWPSGCRAPARIFTVMSSSPGRGLTAGGRPLVGAVGKISQRNPVERVGEKSGYASFLGQP